MSQHKLRTLSVTEGPQEIYSKYLAHLKAFSGNNVIGFRGGFIITTENEITYWCGGPGLKIHFTSTTGASYTLSVEDPRTIELLFPTISYHP